MPEKKTDSLLKLKTVTHHSPGRIFCSREQEKHNRYCTAEDCRGSAKGRKGEWTAVQKNTLDGGEAGAGRGGGIMCFLGISGKDA